MQAPTHAQLLPRPSSPPVYHSDGKAVQRALRLRPGDLFDTLFLLAGSAVAGWLAVLCIVRGLGGSRADLLLLIPFWLVFSYVTLPRVNEVASRLYLPDYYIGRTRTTIGILGDPVNMAFDGSARDVRAAMLGAGWVESEELNLRSSVKMVLATLTRHSYPAAPVSTLLLFGRAEDLSFQRDVGHGTGRRHHIRLWRPPHGWWLPGGRPAQWLAAASFDRAIGFSLFTMQITHKIDADVDAERDYTAQMLSYYDPAITATLLEDLGPGFHTRNGGGDQLSTDGRVVLIGAENAAERAPTPVQELLRARAASRAQNRRLPRLPSNPLLLSAVILGLRWLSVLLTDVASWRRGDSAPLLPGSQLDVPAAVVALVHIGGVALLAGCLVAVFARQRGARYVLILASLIDAVAQLGLATSQPQGAHGLVLLANAALSVVVVVALTSDSVRRWVHTMPNPDRPESDHPDAIG